MTSGGVGLAGARLTAGGGSGISQSNGSYILSLFEGDVTVNVQKDGYYPSDFTVTVVKEQTVHHDENLIKIPTPSRAPTISGTPQTSVYPNSLYSFIPTASDPDGDHISFSISNKPDWAHFNPDNGLMAGIPGPGDIGTYNSIIISVTDSQGTSSSLAPFNVEVMEIEAVECMVCPGIYLLLDNTR